MMNRRLFLFQGAAVLGVASLLKSVKSFAAVTEADVAKDTDKLPVAQFCTDSEKPSATCPERKKPERKGQHCGNCQFYTPDGEVKGKKVGKCTLIPNKHVGINAWCQTWVKKA